MDSLFTPTPIYVPAIDGVSAHNPSTHGELFDLDNPLNPYADCSMVYLPYCTGDVHMGSQDTNYGTDAEPAYIRHRDSLL